MRQSAQMFPNSVPNSESFSDGNQATNSPIESGGLPNHFRRDQESVAEGRAAMSGFASEAFTRCPTDRNCLGADKLRVRAGAWNRPNYQLRLGLFRRIPFGGDGARSSENSKAGVAPGRKSRTSSVGGVFVSRADASTMGNVHFSRALRGWLVAYSVARSQSIEGEELTRCPAKNVKEPR